MAVGKGFTILGDFQLNRNEYTVCPHREKARDRTTEFPLGLCESQSEVLLCSV